MFPCNACNLPLVNGTIICPTCGKTQVVLNNGLTTEDNLPQVSKDSNPVDHQLERPKRKWNNYDYLPFYWFIFLAIISWLALGLPVIILFLGFANMLVFYWFLNENFGDKNL